MITVMLGTTRISIADTTDASYAGDWVTTVS